MYVQSKTDGYGYLYKSVSARVSCVAPGCEPALDEQKPNVPHFIPCSPGVYINLFQDAKPHASLVMSDSKERTTAQKALGFLGIGIALVTIGVTIAAVVDLNALEKAESGNLVRAEFIVNHTRETNLAGSDIFDGHNHYAKFRVETGILSQSHVRVTRIDGFHPDDTPSSKTEKVCESFTIEGASDTDGWYRLGYEFSLAVGANNNITSFNTARNIFAAGTFEDAPGWPKGTDETVTDFFEDYLEDFSYDAFNATADNTVTFADLSGVTTQVFHLNLTSGGAITTPAPARRGRRTVAESAAALCTGFPRVQTDKFFYAGIKFHDVERTPRPDSEALVFSRAVKAMTHALAVTSPYVDVTCFLKQYRDDAHALLMQFETLQTFGWVHLASVIAILVLAALSVHMIKDIGEASAFMMFILVGSSIAYVCYFSWAIGHHVRRVVDAVEDAIPTVTDCASPNSIVVQYDSDAGTTETLYMIVFGMAVGLGALAMILTFMKTNSSADGISRYHSLSF